MNLKTLAGKTVFFALIVLFVMGFSELFGQENSLTGVVVVVLALMMLGQDLSVRPMMNLAGLVAFTLLMGLGAYASVACGNAFVGAVLNLSVVFLLCYMTTQDLRSPMHFPFLLGYAFMLSAPIGAEGIPLRVAALLLGSVFVVGLNVLFHHVSRGRRERDGMVAICREVSSLCTTVKAGSVATTDRLDGLCSTMDGYLYERLKSRFVSRPGDRRMLDVVVSLQVIGTAVCDRERDPAVLDGIAGISDALASFQQGDDMQPLLDRIDSFLREMDADPETRTALRILRDDLWRMSFSTTEERFDEADVPASFRAGTILRENMRLDSVRFTFSFRMALMFSLCAFAWQYSGDENAKALVFTTIAMVQPYLEGTARRTAMRLLGTFVGILAAIASLVIAGGDLGTLTAILLVANYVFTVTAPKRYEVMMAFITLSSLLTAMMTNPPETILTERVAMIIAGVLIASIANRVILPYRLADENIVLGGRYVDVTGGQIRSLADAADGRRDPMGETALVLRAATISSKMRMNVTSRRDLAVEMLLSRQDNLTARIMLLSRSMETADSRCRGIIRDMVGGFDPSGPPETVDTDGLDDKEADLVREAAGILDGYRRDRALYGRISGAGAQHL